MSDEQRLVDATRQLFAVLQERLAFSELSPNDFKADRSAPEATRLAAYVLRRWDDGQISTEAARRELCALAEVIRAAKGPMLTAEEFSNSLDRARRIPHLVASRY